MTYDPSAAPPCGNWMCVTPRKASSVRQLSGSSGPQLLVETLQHQGRGPGPRPGRLKIAWGAVRPGP